MRKRRHPVPLGSVPQDPWGYPSPTLRPEDHPEGPWSRAGGLSTLWGAVLEGKDPPGPPKACSTLFPPRPVPSPDTLTSAPLCPSGAPGTPPRCSHHAHPHPPTLKP